MPPLFCPLARRLSITSFNSSSYFNQLLYTSSSSSSSTGCCLRQSRTSAADLLVGTGLISGKHSNHHTSFLTKGCELSVYQGRKPVAWVACGSPFYTISPLIYHLATLRSHSCIPVVNASLARFPSLLLGISPIYQPVTPANDYLLPSSCVSPLLQLESCPNPLAI